MGSPRALPADRKAVSAPGGAKRRGDPEFAGFRLADSPLYLLVRTAGRYAQELENALNASGMDLPSWRALMIVNEASPSSVSEIAERAVTRLSTMTRVVQRLQKKKLVRLTRRPEDARVTEVHLTSLGRRCVERERRTAGEIYRRAVRDFTATDIGILNALTRRLFANLSACETAPETARPHRRPLRRAVAVPALR